MANALSNPAGGDRLDPNEASRRVPEDGADTDERLGRSTDGGGRADPGDAHDALADPDERPGARADAAPSDAATDAADTPAHGDAESDTREPLVDVEELLAGLIEPPPAAGPDLSGVPLRDLQAELSRRERSVAKLLREKERLRARLAEIDVEVAALSPAPSSPATPAPVAVTYRRPLSELTLAQAIARIYEIGDEFSPSEASERLLDSGYVSRAANFRQIVSQTLAREVRFKRISRGLYQRTA